MTLKLDKKKTEKLIEIAIAEDIGNGDITTNSIIPDNVTISGSFVAKEPGIVAGLPVLDLIFEKFGDKISFETVVRDGGRVSAGDLLASIKGNARVILSYERISLNLLQRLSGIATLTSMFVKQAAKHGIEIVDTRKTTAGWRHVEKYAVRIGGGQNHRSGLFDQVLIKDNHLSILNSRKPENKSYKSMPEIIKGLIINTVHSARKQIPKDMLIEIEVDQLENVRDALESEADIIMFDNMNHDQISTALNIVKDWELETMKKRPTIEVSGKVTLKNIDNIAQKGIDRIAVGAITHSAKALDISLEIDD